MTNICNSFFGVLGSCFCCCCKPKDPETNSESNESNFNTTESQSEQFFYSISNQSFQNDHQIRDFTLSKTDKQLKLSTEYNQIEGINLEDKALIKSYPWNIIFNRYNNVYSSDSSMPKLISKFGGKISRNDLESFVKHNLGPIEVINYAKNLLATKKETFIILTNYINGSYIGDKIYEESQYPHKFSYIATQGPTESSFHQFWFMCWEKECKVIVMLCNFEEKGRERCFEYLPVSEGKVVQTCKNSLEEYIRIECVKRLDFSISKAGIILVHRELQVTKYKLIEGKWESKNIHHIQFTGWPDKKEPNVEDLNYLMTYFRGIYPEENHNDPVVVHCSAGAGRTGTFITIDTTLRKIRTGQEYDLFNCVERLRTKRKHMVNTAEQYKFIHTYLDAYFLVENVNLRKEKNHAQEGRNYMHI